MAEHSMLFIYTPNSSMEELFLDRHRYTIGRNKACDVCLPISSVSRLHATLVFIDADEYRRDEEAHYLIFDGDSQIDGSKSHFGLYVNGKKVDTHKLAHGDVIELGKDSRLNGLYINYFKFASVGKDTEEGGTSS